MTPRESITLFHVAGVPIRIHFSWLFVAAYLTVLLATDFHALATAANVGDVRLLLPAWAWGLLLTLLLFACVVVHELAHVTVARRGGARVKAITLMMLGGISEISDGEEPRLELRMSLAGPLTSLLLGVLFFALFRFSAGGPPDLTFGLFYLVQVNLLLGVFNLLPAFPMDGGRVLRSLLARRFGLLRATQIAGTVGKFVAAALVIVGILGGGLWLALIGLFVFIGGAAEAHGVQARAALRGLKVADLFSRSLALVDAGATVRQAAQAMISARAEVCFVLAGGRPIGLIPAGAIAALPVRERERMPAVALVQRVAAVRPDDELPSVLKLLEDEQLEAAAVLDGGRLIGSLSRRDVARGLELRDLAAAT